MVDKHSAPQSDIRIASMIVGNSLPKTLLKTVGPVLDRVLGIRGIRRVYEQNGLAGLEPHEFAKRVVSGIGVDVRIQHDSVLPIPAKGPVLLVCNHPYGGIEAMILAHELLQVRDDVKIFGNKMLRVLSELNEVMIHTDPLNSSQQNLPSLRQAKQQLESGGVLVVFPAGRVSYFRKDLQRTTDHHWNRLVGYLLSKTEASLVPTFIEGSNSRLFLTLGYLYARLKIVLLPREMLKLTHKRVGVTMGHAVRNKEFSNLSLEASTRFARMMTYLQGVSKSLPPSKTLEHQFLPIADEPDTEMISRQVASLPKAQELLTYRDCVVCYARLDQAPDVIYEIARQRERTFRQYDEGSGQAIDTDEYDEHYVHLFVWDRKQQALVGAYRMGQADRLRALNKLYLSEMFDFDDSFYAKNTAALELGRSFVSLEYQKKHYSLHLLWKGIGAYVRLHPQYDCLYGTVSLSKQYSAKSICAMCDALIERTDEVAAKNTLDIDLGPEWHDYKRQVDGIELDHVGAIVRSLEDDKRDLPVLLRHYKKAGARFLAVGIDRHFNNTPGLLLSLDIKSLPDNKRKLYVDDGK